MKLILATLILLLTTLPYAVGATGTAKQFKPRASDVFRDGETNFNRAMEKLLKEYVDKSLTRDDLYRAASEGMLRSLNSGDAEWNKLLSPNELENLQINLSGKVSGIGVAIKFLENSGNGLVLSTIPNSPAERAGLKADDVLLTVDGRRFKGKEFRDMVAELRGKVGDSVNLKVLRDDRVLNVTVKREVIAWTPVQMINIDSKSALLSIGVFTGETPKLVAENLKKINLGGIKNLVIDVRGNVGGPFEPAVKTAELFIAKDRPVVTTTDRDGKIAKLVSAGAVLDSDVKIVVLTNRDTSSGAEFFTAALRDERNARIVGERTLGKWNAQMIETLPNGYAIKYTVKSFQSPKGNSYQDVGIRPDVEVSLPANVKFEELRHDGPVAKRLESDPQLKASSELF